MRPENIGGQFRSTDMLRRDASFTTHDGGHQPLDYGMSLSYAFERRPQAVRESAPFDVGRHATNSVGQRGVTHVRELN